MEIYVPTTPTEWSQRKVEEYEKAAKVINQGRENPVRFAEEVFGIAMIDYQKWSFMESWWRPYVLWLCSRSAGKTTEAAIFLQTKCFLIPNYTVQIFTNSAGQSIECFKKDWCSGITLTGGDPLSIANIWDTMRLIDAVKKAFPNKNIWVYTGSSWDTVKRKPGIENIDVLVDGEYIDELKSPDKHWVGSSNQNVIDVKVSIRENKLVLWKEG